jgi:uncharacterized protein (DUF4415 family)
LSSTHVERTGSASSPYGRRTDVNSKSIKSDLPRVDALRDEDIDYSDAPALDDSFFSRPVLDWASRKESVTIRLDSDVLAWFKSQGRGYQTRINRLLRMYMDAQNRST